MNLILPSHSAMVTIASKMMYNMSFLEKNRSTEFKFKKKKFA